MNRLAAIAALLWLSGLSGVASARDFTSHVEELTQLPVVRPGYPVPSDANLLFYVQRSANSNTVVYVAPPDRPQEPVEAYWRLFNIDGHTRDLNVAERLFAYGVSNVHASGSATSFHVRALPEQELTLAPDAQGRSAAWTRFDGRLVRLVYAYLQVDDRGLVPGVLWLDLVGVEARTGRPLREHLVPR